MADSVTAVILAGGMGRRMNGADKGLVKLKNHQMTGLIIDILKPNVDEIIINANRNVAEYETFGEKVVSDSLEGYQGPLAGFEAGMAAASTQWLFTCPCDSPLQSPQLLPYMLKSVISENADIGVAHDGQRTHPVFSLLKTDLLSSLQHYLQSGERKIDRWFDQHKLHTVDCSQYASSFININTEEELAQAEQGHYGH